MPFYLNLISAGVASALASFVTTPLDLVKTRIQVIDPNVKPYKGFIRSFIRISKEEGIKGLFSGAKPRLMALSSQTTLSMVICKF